MIRAARPADVPAIRDLIVELATYERAAHEAEATPLQLQGALFGADPAVFCLIAEDDDGPVTAAPCSVSWPGSRSLAGTAGWTGRYSTGTRRRRRSTARSVPVRQRVGPPGA